MGPILYLNTESRRWDIHSIWLHYEGRMLMAIQDVADGLGLDVVHEPGATFHPRLDLSGYGGVVALTNRAKPDRERFWKKWENRLPCVFLGSGAPHNNVESDQEKGMDLLVGHLVGEGHRRLGFFHWDGGTYGYPTKRHAGFIKACGARGLAPNEKHLRFVSRASRVSTREIRKRFEIYWSQKPRPDAICFCTDETAHAFIDWATSKGLKIPGDVAVTGYNDWNRRRLLTTIHYDYTRVGRTAMQVLSEMVQDLRPRQFEAIGVTPTLRVRASSLGRPDNPSLQDERVFRELVESQVAAAPWRETWPEELSHRLHLGRSYFLKKFRRFYGTEFALYLGGLRVERAAFELRHSRRPITDIWLEVGFRSAQHFHQSFHRVFSVSPREYRKKFERAGTGLSSELKF